jgi:broad specificity phosphatase PhoE
MDERGHRAGVRFGLGHSVSDLLLVRHGLCDPVDNVIAGRSAGIHLNAVGLRQVRKLARALAHLPIAAVYSSPLERARETAAALAEPAGLHVRISPALEELDFGAWTGRTLASLADDADWRRFNTERGTTRIPGGETMDEVVARAADGLTRMAADHGAEPVVAVSHGDVIRALLAHYAGMSLDHMLRLEVAPASVSVVRLGPVPRVLTVNWLPDALGDVPLRDR